MLLHICLWLFWYSKWCKKWCNYQKRKLLRHGTCAFLILLESAKLLSKVLAEFTIPKQHGKCWFPLSMRYWQNFIDWKLSDWKTITVVSLQFLDIRDVEILPICVWLVFRFLLSVSFTCWWFHMRGLSFKLIFITVHVIIICNPHCNPNLWCISIRM